MNGRQVPNVASTPAENLENMDLGNGWTVASRITRKKGARGALLHRIQSRGCAG